MDLRELLAATYSDYGMGPRDFNCWGLVRAGLHHLFGAPLLPEFGAIHPANHGELHQAFTQVVPAFAPLQAPEAGAVACFFELGVLVHIGVVIERDGALYVLHINAGAGVMQTPVGRVGLLAQVVSYYRYRGA